MWWWSEKEDFQDQANSYSVTLLLCYSATLLLCYSVTLLLCYSATLLLCYSETFQKLKTLTNFNKLK
jgi:hypothetical protein